MTTNNIPARILLIITLLTGLLCIRTAMADNRKDVETYLKGKMDAVFDVLKNPKLSQEQKNSEIVTIVSPMFDFSLMTKLSFGKIHWSGMTDKQKKQFDDIFVKLLKRSFIEKLVLYTDEKVVIKDAVQENNKVFISTVLISKGSQFDMAYKFYQSGKAWKIYDLEIQNISVISTYRSQIDDVLKTGTYDDLMVKLDKPETKAAENK
ncbi:MAG: ABC transporter substrate-binding protein [Proteobacteria bacterium]|nr:ABC transporter substrate-binding protein [Pseudomonadota bacterium]